MYYLIKLYYQGKCICLTGIVKTQLIVHGAHLPTTIHARMTAYLVQNHLLHQRLHPILPQQVGTVI